MLNPRIVKPHFINSRKVEEKDLERVKQDSQVMYELCYEKHGRYGGGLAVAHCQITDNDPLQFFTTNKNEIIINPRIINHTKTTVKSKEGCLSFADSPERLVDRWNKCVVRYSLLTENGLEEKEENVSGKTAFIFQHEIDHFFSKYIW